jgi:hypothetical protein
VVAGSTPAGCATLKSHFSIKYHKHLKSKNKDSITSNSSFTSNITAYYCTSLHLAKDWLLFG